MFFSVLCLLCLCARLFICALLSPAGKGMTSWLSFMVSLSLSHLSDFKNNASISLMNV